MLRLLSLRRVVGVAVAAPAYLLVLGLYILDIPLAVPAAARAPAVSVPALPHPLAVFVAVVVPCRDVMVLMECP